MFDSRFRHHLNNLYKKSKKIDILTWCQFSFSFHIESIFFKYVIDKFYWSRMPHFSKKKFSIIFKATISKVP